MARRRRDEWADEAAQPGGERTDVDLVAEGVEITRTAGGQGVLVPRAVGRLTGAALQAAAELQDLAMLRARVAEQVDEAVMDARAEGLSWSAIGWSLGTSAQAAQKRWGSTEPGHDGG